MSDKKIKSIAKQIEELEKMRADLSEQKLKNVSEFMLQIGLMDIDTDVLIGALVDTKKRLLDISDADRILLQKEGKKYSKTVRVKAS